MPALILIASNFINYFRSDGANLRELSIAANASLLFRSLRSRDRAS